MPEPILKIENIRVRYSGLPVLHGVSLQVAEGQTVCVVGANGAGKSTLLRAIMGAQRVFEGRIIFRGEEIQKLPTEEIVRMGIIYVPEEKMLFRPLPVEENLVLGAYTVRDKQKVRENLEFVYGLFPRLRERRNQAASTLSGGEQQMAAIGRGLMSNPQLLMLDEPSLGLAPILVDEVLDTVRRLREEGIPILMVEQNVREALDLADRGYVLQTGRITQEGTGQELLESDIFRSAFLGI
ncbi:MAG: ABC transporter ATP-binding protein [Deltaproteobacteria bacterium]|nr:ABC transporter ATP-binding protein [Deltaproteobacteria bacterium]MBW2049190.1 ABC transporter ATP-binding protein [Deltaproteobacteria bacterium]MBW2112665.1 ABC transporter ATP-binding protein [Deltaproteobacteria bacterium]MBW2353887.1 ABC transporter ATP-binding protein [Deltaproteobacteria bacterium]HDZ90936.1 ABC transporter ATP-binding protein [Deltaproteobacteria bacterium]